jgi:hypothetical protein
MPIPERRKNVYFAREVLYAPGVWRQTRERLKSSAALGATPEMANNLPIQISVRSGAINSSRTRRNISQTENQR